MITADDLTFLRRAIGIAAAAIATGDDPYGSLLVGPQGEVLIEAHNTVRGGNDMTAHPELKLARWAARELDPDAAARTTMYTSCQPCGMCGGAIDRSGLGRVVYALSTEPWTRRPARVQPSSGRSSIRALPGGRACPPTGQPCSRRHASPSTATTGRNPSRPGRGAHAGGAGGAQPAPAR